MDDALLWSDTTEESSFQAAKWLDICGRHGITLNPDKFRVAQDVEFAGFEITNDTMRHHARTTSGRHKILVWLSEPSIQYDRRDAAIPGTTQTQQQVPLG